MPSIYPAGKAIRQTLLPDIYAEPNLTPSQFISKWWSAYKANYPGAPRSLNGNVFEELITITLVRQAIIPLYPQASVTYIPGVKYDCM